MIKIRDYYIPATDLHYIEYLKENEHYQEAQRNRAISFVEDWKLAIDIGANIGLWSKDLSKYFDKLVCFEPNIFCHDFIKKNINLDKSKIYSNALGEKEDNKKLFVHSSNSGASSLVNRTKLGLDANKKPIYGEFPKKTKTISTVVKTLDSFNFKKIDFIKIDVQGFELSVLKGGFNTLKENRPVICVEVDDPKNSPIITFLKELNYDLVDVIIKEHIFKKKNYLSKNV